MAVIIRQYVDEGVRIESNRSSIDVIVRDVRGKNGHAVALEIYFSKRINGSWTKGKRRKIELNGLPEHPLQIYNGVSINFGSSSPLYDKKKPSAVVYYYLPAGYRLYPEMIDWRE